MTEATKKPQPARPFKQEALLSLMQGAAIHFSNDPHGMKSALAAAKEMAEGMTAITQQWADENDARKKAKGAQE